jgi:hypothetical protein
MHLLAVTGALQEIFRLLWFLRLLLAGPAS